MKKKSKTQDYLEAKVLYQHGGKIDLNRLHKFDDDEEADPVVINKLVNANPQQT